MYIGQRALSFMQGFLKSYGPSRIKKVLWDREFSRTKWDFIDDTAGDCVYPFLEKYARNGSILDLGCGPGNTANELAENAYQSYVGVDISQAALDKATKRTKKNGREGKNTFARSDFLGFMPSHKFDVILFRESMYHVPFGQVKLMLDRYSTYLKDDAVFIVRMYKSDSKTGVVKNRVKAKMELIEREFEVLEKSEFGESKATVIVFRPRHQS